MYAPNRDRLMLYLEKHGIQTRTMMPLISQPIAKPYLKKKYPIAEQIGEHGLLIGCHQMLSYKDINYIIEKVREFYESADNRE